ncbi:MAG: hypothetical protein ABSE93_07910 [Terriglobia bacterium]|jgi:hypothetical protein
MRCVSDITDNGLRLSSLRITAWQRREGISDHAGTHQAFENDLRAGRTARLQLLVGGTDSNTAGIVLGYAARITEQFTAAG